MILENAELRIKLQRVIEVLKELAVEKGIIELLKSFWK